MPSRSAGALAGEAAHEVELDLPPAAPEGLGGAVVEVLVVDRLADLLAHVVAGDLGGQGQAAAPPLGQQRGDLLEHLGDPQARERDLDPQRREDLAHPRHQLLEVRDSRSSRARAG